LLGKVRNALSELQGIVDDMDPDFDPTAYYTDPDESRLCVANELLDNAACALEEGDSEEAENWLVGEGPAYGDAYDALLEAFQQILDAGLDFCEDDPPSPPSADAPAAGHPAEG
jgi:hypothetical protein